MTFSGDVLTRAGFQLLLACEHLNVINMSYKNMTFKSHIISILRDIINRNKRTENITPQHLFVTLDEGILRDILR